jgi:hypothetical protein
VKGRLIGPTTVELDQALPEGTGEVRVVARVSDDTAGGLSDYLRCLPPGTRTQEDIEQQIREERATWS